MIKKNVSRYDYVYQTTIYKTCKMGEVKQIHFKNRTYYFYNGIINLKFNARLLKIGSKSYKSIGIYNKKINDWEKTYSVNPLYLRIINANGYIEEKDVNEYSIFDSTD